MKYNFNKVVSREETPSYKWNPDILKKSFGSEEVMPLWIADMDFEVSDEIKTALIERIGHGVFGYEFKTDSQKNSLIDWYKKYHSWTIDSKDIRFAPSVLAAIAASIKSFTNEGEKIIIQTPVYGPFLSIIKSTGRQVSSNRLKYEAGKYTIDFEDLEEKAKESRAILISNPHNPVGRVWTKEELRKIGEIAIKHDLLIFSDDIHADIIIEPYKYTSIATINDDIRERTINFLSPGKTFNLSGISTAVIVASNEDLGKAIDKHLEIYHLDTTANALSMVAFEAGYSQSRQWFNQMLDYVTDNLNFVNGYIEKYIKDIKVVQPEGTYLVWIDMTSIDLPTDELQAYLVDQARLGLDYGHWFGEDGAGFVRMNLATPKINIERAMNNLRVALEKLKQRAK